MDIPLSFLIEYIMNISNGEKTRLSLLLILFLIGLLTFPIATIAIVWIGAILYHAFTG